jgi:hypothetical protein
MDITELLSLLDIRQLQREVAELRERHDSTVWDLPRVKELAEENVELRLRLGLLVKLLIAKGVFTAEEYAGLLATARQS